MIWEKTINPGRMRRVRAEREHALPRSVPHGSLLCRVEETVPHGSVFPRTTPKTTAVINTNSQDSCALLDVLRFHHSPFALGLYPSGRVGKQFINNILSSEKVQREEIRNEGRTVVFCPLHELSTPVFEHLIGLFSLNALPLENPSLRSFFTLQHTALEIASLYFLWNCNTEIP